MSSKTINILLNEKQTKSTKEILETVIKAMDEKGYNAKEQVVGYLISGDPSYIPRVENSRNIIKEVSREKMLKDLLESYLLTDD